MIPFLIAAAAAATLGTIAYLSRRRSAADSGSSTPPAGGGDGGAAPTPKANGGGVAACRAAVPVEPGLVKTPAMLGGHYYLGDKDQAHIAYLKSYLDKLASETTGEDKRRILAFRALQGREGSTAAINTYDNQIVTWGTGWGGLGGLPGVMDRLIKNPAVAARLAACGVEYLGKGEWAVDDGTGKIVRGKKDALQVIRQTPALLYLLIDLAKNPNTRDAVTNAQLDHFKATSGSLPGSETISSQALFNLAAHMKHWAPGYMKGAVESAAAAVPGAPSADRDKGLAREIVRAFYRNAPAGSYVHKGWKQLQGYALRDMKADGLDVAGDPVISAAEPPSVGA